MDDKNDSRGEPEFCGAFPIRQEILVLPADEPKKELGWFCHEIIAGSPEADAQNARLNKDVYLATDQADKYRTSHVAHYKRPDEFCWTVIPVLQFLWGKPWNNMALNFMPSLRPGGIRVVGGKAGNCITCDCSTWRVTVYLEDDDRTIRRIEQEVDGGCLGVRYGADLSDYMNGREPYPGSVGAIINPRGVIAGRKSKKDSENE